MKKYIGILALLLNLGGFTLMACIYAPGAKAEDASCDNYNCQSDDASCEESGTCAWSGGGTG